MTTLRPGEFYKLCWKRQAVTARYNGRLRNGKLSFSEFGLWEDKDGRRYA